jgi:hypothetical protein
MQSQLQLGRPMGLAGGRRVELPTRRSSSSAALVSRVVRIKKRAAKPSSGRARARHRRSTTLTQNLPTTTSTNDPHKTKQPAARRRQQSVLASAAASGDAAASSSSSSSPVDAPPVVGSSLNTPFPAATTASSSNSIDSSALSTPPSALAGGGDGGNSSGGGKGGGGGGGGGDNNNENNDDENDPLLNASQAEAAALSAKIELPADMRAAAATVGLRSTALSRYAALKGLAVTGALASRFPAVRDRLLADERFLFKVWAECAIDAGCATVAEVRKRGEHFWGELELYASDLIVGLVLDVVLVTLMAPAAVIGGGRVAAGVAGAAGAAAAKSSSGPLFNSLLAPAQRALARVPSAVFAPDVPSAGLRYSPLARVACLGVKFLEYSLAGIVCGLIGQAAANGLIVVKRNVQRGQREQERRRERDQAAAGGSKSLREYERRLAREEAAEKKKRAKGEASTDPLDAPMPPIIGTALVWGIFMGVSSNLRYQAVFGIERLVGESRAAARLPALAAATTVAVRFVNNVIGGEQFIDFARYFGVQ